jgi:hypothetical protein
MLVLALVVLTSSTFALSLDPRSAAAAVVYVDDTAAGANNGTSWADAFTDLQSALGSAPANAQVWVAEGIYEPTQGSDRTVSFVLTGSELYGGFAGHESSLAERAGLFDTTVLSGDLAGDDGPAFLNSAENSYHVLRSGNVDPLVDGFTVRGGNADGIDEHARGGGLLLDFPGDVPTLRNCRFVANRAATEGGGVHLVGIGTLEMCLFVGNEALAGGGGAWLVGMFEGFTLRRCWFLGNRAGGAGGGGAHANFASFLGCVFSGNSADGAQGGGGLRALDWPILSRCTFVANTALGSALGAGGVLAPGYPYGECDQHFDYSDLILWENRDDSGTGQDAQLRWPADRRPPRVRASCVQGWSGIPCSQDVIGHDPMLVDPDGADDVHGTLDDWPDLGPASPCIDAGVRGRGIHYSPADLLDAAGRRRYVDQLVLGDGRIVDMGALERP